MTFQATPTGRPILEAVTFLTSREGRKNPPIDEAPRKVIPRGWQRHVIQREGKEEHIDQKVYTLCVVERLQEALRRHQVFVASLPPIDLPEVVLEMHVQTNFGSAFVSGV